MGRAVTFIAVLAACFLLYSQRSTIAGLHATVTELHERVQMLQDKVASTGRDATEAHEKIAIRTATAVERLHGELAQLTDKLAAVAPKAAAAVEECKHASEGAVHAAFHEGSATLSTALEVVISRELKTLDEQAQARASDSEAKLHSLVRADMDQLLAREALRLKSQDSAAAGSASSDGQAGVGDAGEHLEATADAPLLQAANDLPPSAPAATAADEGQHAAGDAHAGEGGDHGATHAGGEDHSVATADAIEHLALSKEADVAHAHDGERAAHLQQDHSHTDEEPSHAGGSEDSAVAAAAADGV